MGVGHKLRDWTRRASPPEERLARMDARDELLAFCRSLQLTADRAGLLLCGDVGAATRAILLTSRRLGPVLDIANRHGLATATSRRGEGGAPLEQELALRLAALYAFYLSEDYTDLRGVITGQLAPEGEEVSG